MTLKERALLFILPHEVIAAIQVVFFACNPAKRSFPQEARMPHSDIHSYFPTGFT
jgi:hypothetical protein